jgi:hypothetical protein
MSHQKNRIDGENITIWFMTKSNIVFILEKTSIKAG